VPSRVTVVVTRPGAPGQTLAEELRQAGQPALWLPAFAFGPAPDEAAARASLDAIADFDLAIFVSPQAVHATAALMRRPWPAGTAIAAVGAGTRAAIVALIKGADGATLLAPADIAGTQDSGSEALWPLLQRLPLRRVLLLRAQSGREWLADRLHEAGVAVVPLAVYSRQMSVPSTTLRARLATTARNGLASVISSSDAVRALSQMLAAQPEVLKALREGPALAVHPRIAEKLRAAGFERVVQCAPVCASVLAVLREEQPLESRAGATASGQQHGEQ
jgi:uroporphyrinogen-III synthase